MERPCDDLIIIFLFHCLNMICTNKKAYMNYITGTKIGHT